MICKVCATAADSDYQQGHELCMGETHCDCQHEPVRNNEGRAEGSESTSQS